MRPAAVLWDLDGTLVDTEPYWIEAEFELVAAHGGTWTLDDAHSLIGNALTASAEILQARGGVDLPVAHIVEHLVNAVTARARAHVPWRPGARELLIDLRAGGVRCALVTMSYRPLVDAVLDALPALTFDALVTGDAVEHGKPHPEPYLTAAAQLRMRPRDCLAIEDSLTGIESAEAAGVPVVAVENLVRIPPGPRRHRVDSLAGVSPAMLAVWHSDLQKSLLVADSWGA